MDVLKPSLQCFRLVVSYRTVGENFHFAVPGFTLMRSPSLNALFHKFALFGEFSFAVFVDAWYFHFWEFSYVSTEVASSCSVKSIVLAKCELDSELIDFQLSGPVNVQTCRLLTAYGVPVGPFLIRLSEFSRNAWQNLFCVVI